MKRLLMVLNTQGKNHQKGQELQRPYVAPGGAILSLCCLLILLSACTSPFSGPAQSGTPVVDFTAIPTSPTASISPTAAGTVLPTITLQVIGCPSLSINWDSLVGTHANVNKVQKVICGSLQGAGSLDALVDVRYYSPDARLDFSVYTNLTGTPTRLFGVQGLLNGDVVISSAGTVTTAEVNPMDAIKAAPDIFKEYQWNGTAFAQVLFPGMYPDVTRYQADRSQNLVNGEIAALQPGQTQANITDAWRLSPGGVVSRLAKTVFQWVNYTVTLPTHAAQLNVLPITVTNLGPGSGGVIVTVHHLNEVPTNIYEVEQVSSIDGSVSLSSPAAYAQLTSPVRVIGSSSVTGNIQGQVVFYDDTYVAVAGSGAIHSPVSNGFAQFSDSIGYHLAPGLQEGIIAFYTTNQNNMFLSSQAVLVKVFFRA